MTTDTDDRRPDGTFAKGSAFWRSRETHGRPRAYADGPKLWDACVSYFDWATDNPLLEDKMHAFQGKAAHEPVAHMRAFTLTGLCLHIGISDETWRDWRTSRPDQKETIQRAEAVIRTQKFEGAAAGLLNSNIIIRDLGLTDRREIDDVTPPERKVHSSQEVARALLHMMRDLQSNDTDQDGQ